jgi:quercetin dioxygenase-like cupin family protein
MRKLLGLFSVCALVGVTVGATGAGATPPSGQFSASEYGRAQQSADAKVVVPGGYDVLSSTYTVAPGGDTGWRNGPGTTSLSVTKGALKVSQADGCASQDVAAGKAIVLPAGTFRLQNAGQEPVELLANFTGLPHGGGSPLVDGPTDPAPDCAAFAAAAAPGGVSASKSFRGDVTAYFKQASHEGHGGGAADGYGSKEFSIAGGKDTFMVTVTLQPGFSTGWFAHTEHVAIITKGDWAFYEPHDGKCQKVEEYHAGDAWAHVVHRHLGAVQGDQPAEITLFGYNLKHGDPAPIFGSNADHLDFFQAPPQECPTQLR